MRGIGWDTLLETLPRSPLFYLFTILGYLTWPVAEWYIFRRWWPIGARALALFVRKRVLNDAVLGYSGDAWFFLRTRARNLTPAPLGAIKDVAIMSALAGNVATVAMLVLAMTLGGSAVLGRALSGPAMQSVSLGFLFVLGVSGALLLLSRRVMSLGARRNIRVFAIHSLRLVAAGALLLAAWSTALPAVAISTWILLGALRMVVTRLPFVPNKELLFAALTVSLTGAAAPAVAALMAVAGIVHLLAHIGSFAIASLADNGDALAPPRHRFALPAE